MSQNVSGGQDFQDNPYQATSPVPSLSESNLFNGNQQEISEALRSIARWQSFFAVVGFIGTGLISLGVFFPLLFFAATQRAGITEIFTFVFVLGLTIVVYLIPSILLWNASKNARLLANTGLGSLGQVLGSQRKFWLYVGWLTCIVIGIYVLIVILTFLLGLSGVTI